MLYKLTCLILIVALCYRFYFYLHFMDEKTETKSNSPAQGHLAHVYQSQDVNPRTMIIKPLFLGIIQPSSMCINYITLHKIV